MRPVCAEKNVNFEHHALHALLPSLKRLHHMLVNCPVVENVWQNGGSKQ